MSVPVPNAALFSTLKVLLFATCTPPAKVLIPLNLNVPVPTVLRESVAAVPLMIPVSRFEVPAAELTVSADESVMALGTTRESPRLSVFVPAMVPAVNAPVPKAELFEI